MNECNSMESEAEKDLYGGGSDWLTGGWGDFLEEAERPVIITRPENWEREGWVAVLLDGFQGLHGAADPQPEVLTSRRPCGAQARPSRPPRRGRQGQSQPTSTGSSSFWGQGAA